MADLLSDGNIRVSWVPGIAGIANKSAPTVAELNAGTRLDTVATPDGLKTPASTADVDNSALSSTYDTRMAGRRAFNNSVTIKAQDGTDTYRALLVYRAVGFLVVRRNIDANTAWATAQSVEVYPSQCGERSMDYGPNTIQRYDVPMYNTAAPDVNAVVA